MANSWHVGWLREGVQKWNKRRKRVAFQPDLSGISFFDLLPPDFRDAPKTSRYFEGIDLRGANLVGADLSGLNFFRSKFDRADLTEADLSLSNFEKVSFGGANLRGVTFDHSLLTDATFSDTDLEGASFDSVEANRILAIATRFSSEQISQLPSNSIEAFTSEGEYRQSVRDAKDYAQSAPQKVVGSPERNDERPKKNSYEVFFGTTRNPVYERGAVSGYGAEQFRTTSYGIAKVIVPDGNRLGGIGKRLWKRLFNRKESKLRLDELMTLDPELFFSVLQKVEKTGGTHQRPTIFIHGYNTTFEGAVLRAAQFGHDLGINQGIGLFSWPSRGTEAGYSADEASVERNRYALAEFLESFLCAFPDQGVSVVAHSMGCRCLVGGIEVLAGRNPSALKSIRQVILAAADVDAGIMPHQGAAAVSNAERMTSYVGDKDQALKFSRWLHGYDRVGLVPPAFTMAGLDTVLVNDADLGPFAHGYIGQSRAVIGDVHSLLTKNIPPQERFSIREHLVQGTKIWKLAD